MAYECVYLPKDAPLRKVTVEYRGRSDYPDTSFLEYADTQGYAFFLERRTIGTWAATKTRHGVQNEHLKPFLHTWLYCSLLQEFFEKDYKEADFLRTNHANGGSSRSTVREFNTSKLWEYIRRWVHRMEEDIGEDGKRTCLRLKNCVDVVFETLNLTRSDLDDLSKQVLCITAQNLGVALSSVAVRNGIDKAESWGWLGWSRLGWSDADVHRMVWVFFLPVCLCSSTRDCPA